MERIPASSRPWTWVGWLVALLLAPASLVFGQAIYTVILTTDSVAPVPGELRWAVGMANADLQDSIINFAIPGASPQTIVLQQGPLFITPENRTWVQGPGRGAVQINANGATQAFVIKTSGNAISGLSIYNASQEQVLIDGAPPVPRAMTNWIYDCNLGLDSLGAAAGTNQRGVRITGQNAAYNLVGTDGVPVSPGPGGTPGMCGEMGMPPPPANIATGTNPNINERCYISNNNTPNPLGPAAGVYIDTSSYSNRVAGNFIGTDPNGIAAIPNGEGVMIDLALENCVGLSDSAAPVGYLGGAEHEEWNLISGNNLNGVLIDASNNNWVSGNIIGLDVTGTAPLAGVNPGNVQNGVWVMVNSQGNMIGTDGDGVADVVAGAPTGGEGNILSNNGFSGVFVNTNSLQTRIKGNFIGTDITGLLPRGNGTNGVEVDTAPSTVVGTDSDNVSDLVERNVIAGNTGRGVFIASSMVVVWGNIIGLNAVEGSIAGNLLSGVELNGATMCSVGFDTGALGAFLFPAPLPSAKQRNVISENGLHGVLLSGTPCTNNAIFGNWIGTNSTETVAFGNGSCGVAAILGANANLIGSPPVTGSYFPNVIRNNNLDGVRIDGAIAPTNQNKVSGNSISNNNQKGIETINTGNTEEVPPVVTTINFPGTTVSGTSVAEDGSVVEVFWDNADEGMGYLGQGTVTTGTWTVPSITWPALGTFNVTATVTDTTGNTSEFALGGATAVHDWKELDQ